jgi:hypothetical protein
VPLIWFIVAIPTPYFATMLTAPLLDWEKNINKKIDLIF